MNPEPIDVGRLAFRALRALDDGRRAVEKQWQEWTKPRPEQGKPPADPREPPSVW
ncbi:MAG: hypothetical protein LCH96_17235 [Actinobacteria bacterium]|nr:hypothetical protein [Actinomycetota bacterium]